MDGGSHHRTSEGPALAGGGGGGAAAAAGEQSILRFRIRCNPKVADHKPREIVSPDSEASGRVSGEGLRVHESACGGGDEELASDQHATVEHVSRRTNEGPRSAIPKDEDAIADRFVDAAPGGSAKRKHTSKGPEFPTCPECGKTFRSDKSLFGHLRCHPERDYRGVNPPHNARKSHQSNAPPPMAKWPPAKKAPKVTTATAAADNDEDPETTATAAADNDEDPETTAALILIHLSDAKNWGPKTAVIANQEETDTDTKQVVRIYCDRIDSLGWSKNNNNGDEPPRSSCKKTKKRKLKELEMVNDSNSSSSNYGGSSRRYQCSICLKAFSSHQALGGHIASHNKQKNNPSEAAPSTAGDDEGAKLNKHGQQMSHTNTVAVIKVAMPEHRCTNCNQTFQSGQALGGHKRRHFNELHQAPSSSSAENRSAPSSSPVESSENEKGGANNELLHSSESDKGQNRGPFKFDLNEVPEH